MTNIHEIIKLAAEDSEQAYNDNLDRPPSMRMSRAGLSLFHLCFEDFIYPRLPKLTEDKKTDSLTQSQVNKIIRKEMAISTGFLYEKVVGSHLAQEYGLTPWSQVKLNYYGITGTLDYLVINHREKIAIVVECKALDVSSLREAKETKLFTDDWGYLSQLSLYGAALKFTYPEYDVVCQWRVWAKKISKSFTCVLPLDYMCDFQDLFKRKEAYDHFQLAFNHQDIRSCVDIMMEELPPLRKFYYGNLTAGCGLHFNPWIDALLDADGAEADFTRDNLAIMLAYCFDSNLENPCKLLDISPYTVV